MESNTWQPLPKTLELVTPKNPLSEDQIVIGQIPQSETDIVNQLTTYAESLRLTIQKLDPRLQYEERYDPIDLAFRIANAVTELHTLRNSILKFANVIEMPNGNYAHMSDLS